LKRLHHVAAAGFVVAFAGAAGAAPALTAADYARAEKVLDSSLAGAVRNGRVAAHWIGDEDRFWYRRDGADGVEYALIDATAATRSTLYDRARLTAALAETPLRGISPPLERVERVDGRLHATFAAAGGVVATCDLERYTCKTAPQQAPATDALASPDGDTEAFARDNNLWLRRRGGGDERALTRDGAAWFAYGKLPDASLAAIPQRRAPRALPPIGVAWSRNGRFLFGTRVDERAVATYPFVESVPQDGSFRPIVYDLRLPLLGDAAQPKIEAFVVDVQTGVKRTLDIGDGATFDADAAFAWSADGGTAWVLVGGKDARRLSLAQIDLAAGSVRHVVDESGKTSVMPNNLLYSAPAVRVLRDTREAVWFSERSGWGHLYLYDLAKGKKKRALTEGDWLVRDLVHVDGKRRIAWFTASGREPGRDPYYRHLYRVSLDGGRPVLLTPENAEHEIDSPLATMVGPAPEGAAFSPNARWFVDTYSTVSTPPVTVLRRADDGRVVMKLEDADVSRVTASGWRPPERVAAKSVDGKTDLYATIYFPPGFTREKKYPVIDAFYGGPQMMNAPRSYAEAVRTFNPVSRASLAELGFVVVTIDARGTRGRSKAFADIGYGNFADPQIDDHVAVLGQLAQRYGGFDLDRVGVYGHSFGGYTSARAILARPEFYKVAASSAGPHNYQGFYDGLAGLLDVPDYGDGVRVRPTPQSIPANFKAMDNATLAPNLRGHLLLAYGEMDENALPSVTLQLADALIRANKTFDLVYLPNRTHDFFRTDRYYLRRVWDHFVEHLAGATPPANFDLSPPAKN
jgi:dipeptidyl aminopeptidase/acylaminoacyl peptidase